MFKRSLQTVSASAAGKEGPSVNTVFAKRFKTFTSFENSFVEIFFVFYRELSVTQLSKK